MIASKSQPRRADILEAATTLFSERGFHGTRMDDIAEAANLNKATIYHYYDTKATILFELCMDATIALLSQLKDLDSFPSAAEALGDYTRSLFNVIADHSRRALVHFQESPFLDEWLGAEHVEQVRALENESESYLRRIMERGVKDGTFKDFDPRFMALGYSGLTNWFYRWYCPPGDLPPDEIADLFVTMFLGGLLAEIPRPSPTSPPQIGKRAQASKSTGRSRHRTALRVQRPGRGAPDRAGPLIHPRHEPERHQSR